jgi:hypothetical protein
MVDVRNEAAGDLEQQLRRLTEENERLRAQAPPRPRQVWRSAAVVLLLALATLLAPAAVVAAWARVQLTTADSFVDTFAPLADDPQVQAFVADQVVDTINGAVDIPGLTKDVFDGIGQLGLPPRAAAAVQLLQAPAAQGIQSFISSGVDNVVRSEAFRDLWRQGLRAAHGSLVGLQGDLTDPSRAVTVSGTGEIGLQLRPVIAAVKARLVARGVPLASNIPEIDKTIVVAKTDAVPTIRTAYSAAVAAGTWLPFVVLALFIGAILLARRRRRTLVAAAVCLFAAMLVTAIGIGLGRIFFSNAVSPDPIPAGAADVIYTQTLTLLRSSILAIGALALFVAVAAWFGGPEDPARRVRQLTVDAAAATRSAAEARGVTTGRFGEWLGAHDRAIRVVIAIAAAAALLLLRPLSFSDVVWVAVLALAALLLLLFLSRPRGGLPTVPGEEAHTPAVAGLT